MFSVVVAGRLPLPAPQQIDETHAVFPLEDAPSINHVVVFMTGQQPFPQGFAATVHLNWKSAAQQDKWILLGCLKNEKPSAIFRIKGLTSSGTSIDSTAIASAAIGISIEQVANVDAQMSTLSTNKSFTASSSEANMGQDSKASGDQSLALVKPGGAFVSVDAATQTAMALAMAPRIANNIFSFLSSFAPDSATQTVPLLKRWLEQFERKLKAQGIGFLAKSEAE